MITKFFKWLHNSWVYPVYSWMLNQTIASARQDNELYYTMPTSFGLLTMVCQKTYDLGLSKTLKPEIFFLMERKRYWDNAPSNGIEYDQYTNNRVNDITTAMGRYNTGLKPVPVEWIDEYLVLLHIQDVPTYSGDFV